MAAENLGVPKPGPGWIKNEGKPPTRKKGKRCNVVLANGNVARDTGRSDAPPGWAVESTRWSITGSPFDVAWSKVL